MTTENTTMVINTNATSNGMAPIREYDKLSHKEQQIVDSLMKKLDDYSINSLIDFSSDSSAESAQEAEYFLKTTKLNDLQEFHDCMGSLTRDLRSIDTKELSKRDPSPLSRIPLIGKALSESRVGKKVDSIIERQQTVQKSINLTVQTIEGIKITLREDLIRCSKTREKTIEFAKNLEYEYIALFKKKQELENSYQTFISSSEYDVSNLDHSEYVNKLQDGIQLIERKMDALLRYRINAIQDIPSLSLISTSENAMINSIDDCIKNVIPEWNKAFLKAILAYRVANAADVMKSTKEATNSILLNSADMTSKAIISVAEAIETPQIASETLEKKTEIFISTCNQLVQIAMEASKQRAADAVKFKEMEKQSLFESIKRKTISPINHENGGLISNV